VSALRDDDLLAFVESFEDLGGGVADEAELDLYASGGAVGLEYLDYAGGAAALDGGGGDDEDVVDAADDDFGFGGLAAV
jgi:hypothetical protein